MSSSENLQIRIQHEIAQLTESISGLVTTFRKLQRPLVESREKVPQATNQLDKISQQTEAVTSRMLDVVEQMTQREEEVIRGIDQIRLQAGNATTEEVTQLAQGLVVKATDNLNATYQIMESLQFQDITAQQMDYAAALLEDIEGKLHSILTTLGAKDVLGTKVPRKLPRKPRAYDPHADLVNHRTEQKDIDWLFSNKGR